jgi:hypothetical protein
VTSRRDLDVGTGYRRPRPSSMRELTDVGAGTPMGELLRRYWHPAGLVGGTTLYYGSRSAASAAATTAGPSTGKAATRSA